MSSTKQRGDKAEKQVIQILESNNIYAIQSPRTMKRIWTKKGIMFVSQSNDYWNIFDVLGKSSTNKTTRYIQVKSTAPHVSTMKPLIKEFADKYGNEHDLFQIWQKVSRRGFIVHHYNHMSTKEWLKTFVDFKGRVVDVFK